MNVLSSHQSSDKVIRYDPVATTQVHNDENPAVDAWHVDLF